MAVRPEEEVMVLGAFITLTAGWLVVIAVLVLDMAGIRRLGGAGRRWQGAGILLSTSGIMISSWAALRGWPPDGLRRIHPVTVVFVLAGTVILIAGLGIQARSSHGSSQN